jgi:hypothetical protein
VHSTRIGGACVLALTLLACPSGGRDVVTDSRDVRGVQPDASAPPRTDGYAYVARRVHGAVGMVGAHYMKDEDARRIVDRIADELETCARRLEESGTLVEGALQLVAVTGARGTAEVTDIRFAPGGPVAANALECIVAPLRASPFPAGTDAGVPAVAIEATWSPNRTGKPDSGSPL